METGSTFDGFRYNWPIWTICGINPPKRFRVLYFIYRIWFILFILIAFTITLSAKFLFIDDFKTFISSLAVSAEIVVANVKYAFIFVKFKMLKSLEGEFEELDNLAKSPEQKRQRAKVVRKCHNIFKFLTTEYGLCWLASGGAIAYLITKKTLLYPAWFPFNWESSVLLSVIVALYQFIAVGAEIFLNACNDTVPAILLSILEGHYQCLAIALSDIEPCTPENAEANYRKLVGCIKYHQRIESIFQSISQLISIQLFIQLFATALVLCASAAVILFCEADTTEILYYGFYGFGLMIEVFVACFFGTEFNFQTNLLTTQLFSCNWIGQSRQFKMDLLILMANSMKSKIVLAGGVVPVTLDTFISIVKFSYSLLAVFKGMQ